VTGEPILAGHPAKTRRWAAARLTRTASRVLRSRSPV